jgi:hypothetical protein
MRRLGLLDQRGLLPLVAAIDSVPHLSGIVSLSGGGDILKSSLFLKIFRTSLI